MSEENQVEIVDSLLEQQISPEQLRSITALRTSRVPPQHISQHPGKGGKVFKYVKHIDATETMNNAFGMNWDWQIIETVMYPDKTATARGQMTLWFNDKNGNLRHRTITEVGAFEDLTGKMSHANIVLGACSRVLLRCMLRAFGYGQELYDNDEPPMTNKMAWEIIWKYCHETLKVNISQTDLQAKLKEKGITGEVMVDRFEEAYALVAEIAKEQRSAKK